MILEHLYESLSDENIKPINCKELRDIMEKIETTLQNQTSLDETNITDLCDLITDTQYIIQKQGFINGFRYAMQMLSECL